jgi:hypothetical protein
VALTATASFAIMTALVNSDQRRLNIIMKQKVRDKMACVEFEKTIRGTEVIVFADHFTEDRSTGLNLGPEDVWAETTDGAVFDLTYEETEQLGIEATDIYCDKTSYMDDF